MSQPVQKEPVYGPVPTATLMGQVEAGVRLVTVMVSFGAKPTVHHLTHWQSSLLINTIILISLTFLLLTDSTCQWNLAPIRVGVGGSDVPQTSMVSVLASYGLREGAIIHALCIRAIITVVTLEDAQQLVFQDFSRIGVLTLIATPRMTKLAHLLVLVEPTIGLYFVRENV